MNINQVEFYQKKLSYEMDSWDVFEALKANQKVVVVDGRGHAAYAKERIPGSINIPHRTICSDVVKDLKKDNIYVCYCDGIGCNASTKTALKLTVLGFEVRELIGGLEWWKRDSYKTEGSQSHSGTWLD